MSTNIYEQEFTTEFKENLPVKWELWKNKDLTNIPKEYHILFQTDWNWGPYSSMDMTRRMELNQLWLEYKHWDVKQKINYGV